VEVSSFRCSEDSTARRDDAVTIAKRIAGDESLASSQGITDSETFACDESVTLEGGSSDVACEDEDALVSGSRLCRLM